MDQDDALALVHHGLERTAAQLGDITQPVLERFYARMPEARGSFEQHWPGKATQLEEEMTGNALYFIMTWHERPTEVRYALWSSVPHHQVALGIPANWYGAFMDAAIEIICETAGPADMAEKAMWQDMRAAFRQLIETC